MHGCAVTSPISAWLRCELARCARYVPRLTPVGDVLGQPPELSVQQLALKRPPSRLEARQERAAAIAHNAGGGARPLGADSMVGRGRG